MKASVLKEYARLLAVSGVAVSKDETVIIYAGLDQPDFVYDCVDACYKAGAAKVIVEWSYQPLSILDVRYQKLSVLGSVDELALAKLKYRLDHNPSLLYLLSDDPDGLKGINQKKQSRAIQMRYGVIKPYREKMENHYKWCIAAVPGIAWAKKVFPGIRGSQAVEKLWRAILFTSRVIDADGNLKDAVAEWKRHNLNCKNRCDFLNGLHIASLEYKASNGTDLTVGLIPNGVFCGGSDTTLEGLEFNPNIPTEEIFTSPMKGKAEGIVYSSMPLSYRGQIIDGFSIRFRDGRAVEVQAATNLDLLKQLISMDEGASMLGECALVPFDSPVRQSGVTFYETLFDENAACHLALGHGFNNCVADYGKYTLEQLRDAGINDSMIHTDFMIGTRDLTVTAVGADGTRTVIFKDGTWAI